MILPLVILDTTFHFEKLYAKKRGCSVLLLGIVPSSFPSQRQYRFRKREEEKMQAVFEPIGAREASRSRHQSKPGKNQSRDALIAQKLSAFLTIKILDEEIKHNLAHLIIPHQIEFWHTLSKITRLIKNIEYYFCVSVPLLLLILSSQLMNEVLHVGLYKYPSFNNILISFFMFTILIFLLMLITIIPLVVSSIIIFYLIKHLFLKFAYIKYPSHFVIDNLISMLIIMEEELDSPMSIHNKRRLIKLLEHTARCIERDLPRRFHTEDTITKAWMKERFKQVAAALREEKKCILIPEDHTHDTFINSIASTLIYFVTDNWGALKVKEPEKLTRSQLRSNIATVLLNTLKTLLIAALPFGFFFILQPFFHLTGPIFDTVVSILSLFAVTVLASAFDPNFSTHLGNAKDLDSLLPGARGKL